MQQKVTLQSEALEIAMRLEASPMSKSTLGMDQLEKQLVNITPELQSLKKGKEVREEVWCTRCRTEGHPKEQCPIFEQYLASGVPNPLPQTCGLWCKICKQVGHRPQDYHMVQKYTKTSKNIYCTFCSSIGHDDNHYRALDMMMERTQDIYAMQSEQQNHPAEGAQYDLGRGGYAMRGGYEGVDIEVEEAVKEPLAEEEDRSSIITVENKVSSPETAPRLHVPILKLPTMLSKTVQSYWQRSRRNSRVRTSNSLE